jgi:hypothetical protein
MQQCIFASGKPIKRPNKKARDCLWFYSDKIRNEWSKRAHFSSGGGETQLRWHDNFAQDPIVVVGRVAQATDVDFRAMRQDSARV